MLYTLNLPSTTCQIYLNNAVKNYLISIKLFLPSFSLVCGNRVILEWIYIEVVYVEVEFYLSLGSLKQG